MMTGIASLPRDIQKLADAKGWEEEDLHGLMAAFVAQNSLEDELLEFLQEEAEQLGENTPGEQEDDPDLDD
ncbi:hypothetical protein [Sphingomonas sp. GC_Shp_3]|uniref:hypothetical protein n=1 Tax=Sphingomonas sp. GC_Shp_3 TaxID=2937383 RepID=UPI00226A5352|nr:hypothetical protein [Sphingomonas sp. GC_Shp_3]